MALGLTSTIQSKKLITPGIVTDNLVLKHKYDAGSVIPCSDGAAYFDGVSASRINLGNTFQTELRGSYSVGMWLKPLDGGASDAVMGARKDAGSGTYNNWFYVGYNSTSGGDSIIYHKSNGTSDIGYSDSPQFSSTKKDWLHIVWSVTKSAVGGFKTYVNGALVGTANSNAISEADWESYTSDINMVLGAYATETGSSNNFVGYMCNAFIYNEAISQETVKSIMNKNYAGLTDSDKTNLVSWWNLDVETNTSGESGTGGVKDHHGSNHGTLL